MAKLHASGVVRSSPFAFHLESDLEGWRKAPLPFREVTQFPAKLPTWA
jgi:hypothetical protein